MTEYQLLYEAQAAAGRGRSYAEVAMHRSQPARIEATRSAISQLAQAQDLLERSLTAQRTGEPA